MNKNKKRLVLSLLGVLGLIVITSAITYAFFNYAKEGTTENTITTGTITFLYTEVSGVGRGISIDDAFPISDTQGKAQIGEGKVFDFKVTSTIQLDATIPYEVTARMKSDSTLDQDVVRMYLTEVDGTTESQVLLDNYSNLAQTAVNVPEGTVEKVIYTNTVPAGTVDYEKNFRLKMWIDEDIKFTQNADGTYPYNAKKFTVTVNVYANAEVVNVSNATTYQSYNIGDVVTATDGSKWHVLEASGNDSSTVILLSDYNLNSDGTYNTTCGSTVDGNYRCSAIAFDTDNTNTYDENDSNNIGYFIKNTYEPLVITALSGTTNVTLPTALQIATADGQTFNQSSLSLSSSWLLTTNYWTKTDNTSGIDYVFNVNVLSSILGNDQASVSYFFGARPVITTPKSNLISG